MKKTRITDLEKFVLEHIVRPYQDRGGFGEEQLNSLPLPMDCIIDMLNEENEWTKLVLNRISKIGFTFPEYIKHPLVKIVKDACKSTITKQTE
jgi:hypothetical protein